MNHQIHAMATPGGWGGHETKRYITLGARMTVMINQFIIRSVIGVLIGGIGVITSACAADKTTEGVDREVGKAPEVALEKSDGTRVLSMSNQLGPRDTALFYPYYEKRAVVMIQISNSDKTFPTRGSVMLFPATTTRDGIDKWINNAHSDGRFIDPAKPSETIKLPAEIFSVKDLGGTDQETRASDGQQVFVRHNVNVSVKKHHVAGKFTLSAMEDAAAVYLKKP